MNDKHPIDELFRSKLGSYKSPTNEHLKSRFLEAIEKDKKKIVVFPWRYFSAAASFLAVAAVGLYFWTNAVPESGPVAQTVSTTPKVEKTQTKTQEVEPLPEEVQNATLLMESKKVVLAIKSVVNNKEEANKETVELNEIGLPIMDNIIPDELTLAVRKNEKKEALAPEEKGGNLFQKESGNTYIIVASSKPAQETIYMPDINADSPITIAEARQLAEENKQLENKAIFAKIFEEINHLKHGEKADLSILAKNEETLIGHEAAQVRDRINWFKSILKRH